VICFSATEVKKDVTQNGDECMLARVDDDDGTIVVVCTVVALNDEAKQRDEEDLREESKSSLRCDDHGDKNAAFSRAMQNQRQRPQRGAKMKSSVYHRRGLDRRASVSREEEERRKQRQHST